MRQVISSISSSPTLSTLFTSRRPAHAATSDQPTTQSVRVPSTKRFGLGRRNRRTTIGGEVKWSCPTCGASSEAPPSQIFQHRIVCCSAPAQFSEDEDEDPQRRGVHMMRKTKLPLFLVEGFMPSASTPNLSPPQMRDSTMDDDSDNSTPVLRRTQCMYPGDS
eukprot:c2638_g1_i2.p1 GENE.c2638_g1_i2~~c2638_g1_i2.p1  ORF type:complete len:163 (+),score=18.92 c2638_g1_i2:103-591(+)